MFSTVIESSPIPHHPHGTPLPISQETNFESNPNLTFIQQYTAKVDSLNLSGPSTRWYAPSAIFYNGDATTYRSSEAIWSWMQQLFSPFSGLHHRVLRTHVVPDSSDHSPSSAPDFDLFILEAETSFWLKAPLEGEPIVAPRLLMFLVGPEEVQGQGTGGRQIWEAKAYWDSAILTREVQNRKAAIAGIQ
jgi:hypothetical protein